MKNSLQYKWGLSVLILLLIPFFNFSQNSASNKLDSLLTIYEKAVVDSIKLSAASEIIELYYRNEDTVEFIKFYNECLSIHDEKSKYSLIIKEFYGYYNFKYLKNPLMGKTILLETIESFKKLNLLNEQASVTIGLGIMFKRNALYEEAIHYYFEAIKIYEKINDLKGLGDAYNNIANIFSLTNDEYKSIEYHLKSLDYRLKNNSASDVNISLFGIGLSYYNLNNIDSSLYYFEKTIEETEKLNQSSILSKAVSMVGIIYADQKNYEKALPYYEKALEIRVNTSDKYGIYTSQVNLANLYMNFDFKPIIKQYCQESYEYAKASNELFLQRNACECLYKFYQRKNEYKSAFDFLSEYVQLNDSIKSEENKTEIITKGIASEYALKATADSVEYVKSKEIDELKISKQENEIKSRKTQQNYLFVGLALLFIFSLFIWNRFSVTRKQKSLIIKQKDEVERQRILADSLRKVAENQKVLVEEKNKEITDSITYAKRIQEAILPSRYSLIENLKNGFVLYKPKDLVSGDFYWLEKTTPVPPLMEGAMGAVSNGGEMGEVVYFAAADCTGHGVPGAMVSVVCSNALSKSLLEEGITKPGEILDRTRELVIERFAKSGEEVKDGMDISLCAFSNSQRKIWWAGANNPLWLIRNNELIEYKGDKQPIGKFSDAKNFTTYEISIQNGDTFYLLTDGFADQFGGEKGKKFMYKPLKELLLSINHQEMDEQKIILEKEFENWKGNLEQVDDVCIIGIRL